MIIYEVNYPFEVDMEYGLSTKLYTSMKKALEEALDYYQRTKEEEENWGRSEADCQYRLPAQVNKCKVVTLTKGAICGIINSCGHWWQEEEEMVGHIHFENGKVKFRKTVED